MLPVIRLWAQLSPEAKSFVMLSLAGVLGAVATVALERKPVMPPRWRRGALHLGFVGTMVISIVAAHAVDHNFGTALMGAVCGGATLRRLKREIDRGFDGWRPEPEGKVDDE